MQQLNFLMQAVNRDLAIFSAPLSSASRLFHLLFTVYKKMLSFLLLVKLNLLLVSRPVLLGKTRHPQI